MSDQNIISPYNINTIKSRQVMGIENIYIYVNYRIINWSNTKFFELTSKELYQQEVGRITDEILEVKGLLTKEGLPPFVTTEEHPRFWRKFQTKAYSWLCLCIPYDFIFTNLDFRTVMKCIFKVCLVDCSCRRCKENQRF